MPAHARPAQLIYLQRLRAFFTGFFLFALSGDEARFSEAEGRGSVTSSASSDVTAPTRSGFLAILGNAFALPQDGEGRALGGLGG